jgi:ketosteroid isomerase-like protein
MQKLVRLVIVLALIGLGFGGWRILHSPERLIRSRLQHLAGAASFEPKDGTLVRAYKINQIPEFFTPDVVIVFDLRGFGHWNLEGRDEVREKASGALSGQVWSGMEMKLRDISVTLGPDKQTAVANLTSEITVNGQRDFIVTELNVMFRKVDGKWLIYRVETVKTLSWRRGRGVGVASGSRVGPA